eukprot:COSAG06_NODE_22_length_33148_cov_102.016279_18_plen_159_part_00
MPTSGLLVGVWTLSDDDPSEMSAYAAMKMDRFYTDHPASMMQTLQQRSSREEESSTRDSIKAAPTSDAVQVDPAPLDEAAIDFFREQGYVILPKLVAEPLLQSYRDQFWDHIGANPNDRATWPEAPPGGGQLPNIMGLRPNLGDLPEVAGVRNVHRST